MFGLHLGRDPFGMYSFPVLTMLFSMNLWVAWSVEWTGGWEKICSSVCVYCSQSALLWLGLG